MASNTSSAENITMQESDVLACAFAQWYGQFKQVTFKSEIIPLSEEFVRFLLSDGIYMPALGGERDGDDSSLEDEPPGGSDSDDDSTDGEVRNTFPEVEEQINAAIARLGGAVLPKLNWSAPKDATWVQSTMKCSKAHEVIMLLKASDYVSHDLCHSFDHCSTSRTRPDEFTLVLRRWHELYESSEFRCFVADSTLLAISQRDTAGFYEHLVDQSERDTLEQTIRGFFEQHVQGHFLLPRYVFDVYVAAPPQRKVRLMDFSPWGPSTDQCLFDWSELEGLAAAAPVASATGKAPEFRVVMDESERRGKAERYSQMPLELAQLSAGEGVDDFIKKADKLLEKKEKEEQ